MNPGLADYYRPDGLQAVATVTVLKIPTDGTTVTVNGTVYTYGSAGWRGRTVDEVAQYLAAAINADRNKQDRHTKTNPVTEVWAMHYGTTVRLIASQPGTAGNSLTLATSVAAEFTVSGATFSGGTDSPVVTALGVQQKTWAKATFTSSGTPGTATVLSGTALWVRYFKIFAKSDNTNDGVIGPTSAADMETVAVGLPVQVDSPAGTSLNLGAWYGKSSAASQVFYIYYCPA